MAFAASTVVLGGAAAVASTSIEDEHEDDVTTSDVQASMGRVVESVDTIQLVTAAATIVLPSLIQVSDDADFIQPPRSIDLTAYSVDDPESIWVVVNKSRGLDPLDHAPAELENVRGVPVHVGAAEDLEELLNAAHDDGVRLGMRNAYRGFERQTDIYNTNVRNHGTEHTDRFSARPGHTEHQTGLAVDFSSTSQPDCDLRQCFDDTVEGEWLLENAWEFGFIHRYSAENEEITGYANEGWHYRYVGRDLAAYMQEEEISTLEELFGLPGGTEYAD